MLSKRWIPLATAVIGLAMAGTSCRRDTGTDRSTASDPAVRAPAEADAGRTAAKREQDRDEDRKPRSSRTDEDKPASADRPSSRSRDDGEKPDDRKQKRTRPVADSTSRDDARADSKDRSGAAKSGGGKDDAPAPDANVAFAKIPAWTPWEPSNAGEKLMMGFVLGADEPTKEAAKMAVTQTAAGDGRVQAVIDRLVEKFATPPPPTVKRAELTASGLPITLVDIVGVYQPGEGKDARPDYRIFCALIENGEWVTVVKVIGPDDAIQENQSAILDMIRSARPR